MKRLLKTALLLLCANAAFGQISLQVFNYRPTGELGFIMKPTFSGSLGYMRPFDASRFRFRADITFLALKSRMNEFPVFGVEDDGGAVSVLPGSQSFRKMDFLIASGGVDFAFIRKEKFFAYAGLSIVFGAGAVEYEDHIETSSNESYSGGGVLAGFRGRLGVEYDINEKIGLFVDAEREGWLLNEPASISAANRYGIGVKYTF